MSDANETRVPETTADIPAPKGVWRPGRQPGAGRPKGSKSISAIMQKVLELRIEDPELYGLRNPQSVDRDENTKTAVGISRREAIALQLIEHACRGNLNAIEMVINRLEGKPLQRSENMGVKLTYAEYLETLSDEERVELEELME